MHIVTIFKTILKIVLTNIVSCHPAAISWVRFNPPDWVGVHVLHQPQPVQQLAHHHLLLLERCTGAGGNLHVSTAVEVTSPQQPFEQYDVKEFQPPRVNLT